MLIPGGFGIRGIEGKIGAISYARSRGLPVLGLCLGLQCIVIEAARSVGLSRRTPPNSIRNPGPGHLHDGRSGGDRRRRSRPRRHHAAGRISRRARTGFHCRPGVSGHRGVRAASASLRGQQRLPGSDRRERLEVLRDFPRRPSGGVRRIPAGDTPLRRRYPGASGVEEPADPSAPAIRRVRRCGHGLQGGRAAAGGDSRTAGERQ